MLHIVMKFLLNGDATWEIGYSGDSSSWHDCLTGQVNVLDPMYTRAGSYSGAGVGIYTYTGRKWEKAYNYMVRISLTP